MNLSGHYFVYDDVHSARYGLRFLRINTEKLTRLAADISYNTSFNKYDKSFTINGIDYSSSPAEFEVEILSERPISQAVAKRITKWLFNRADYRALYTDPNYDNTREYVRGVAKREYINCVFYNPVEISFADGLHGWKATCLTSSNMALQESVSIEFTGLNGEETEKSIVVDTDIDDYVYPIITITAASNVSNRYPEIINQTDNYRSFKLNSITSGQLVIVNNKIGTAKTNAGVSVYEKVDGKRFFRLVPGKNDLTLKDIEAVNITFSNSRWLK